MKGPAGDTNWVIPGKLLVGSAPNDARMAGKIARARIDVFVSLLDDYDYKHRFKPAEYREIADRVGVVLVPYPITDGGVASDKEAFYLARQIYAMLKSGVRVYLHCWGGHGRAGTIAAMLVGLWYRVDLPTALRHVKASHDTRGYPKRGVQYKTPQTGEQVLQVERFFADIGAHRAAVLSQMR